MADLIAILLASLAGFFQAGADPQQLSEAMADAVLETQPVPVAAAEVECGKPTTQGISEVSFELSGLTLDPLDIDQAGIRVSNIRQLGDGSITFGDLHWVARINDRALTAALRSHVEKLSDAEVKADSDQITLKGTYPVWPVRIPYQVVGMLEVQHQTQLVFSISKTGISGLRLPPALNNLIESEINPVYDLAQFAARSKKDLDNAKAKLSYEFMLDIEEIVVKDGYLLVKGDA